MKILFIGDVVGKPGRDILAAQIGRLKDKYNPTFMLVNGENAANGRGITKKIYQQFLELGFHGVTMGNHTWDNRDIFDWIDDADRIVRPANYPDGTPGCRGDGVEAAREEARRHQCDGDGLPPVAQLSVSNGRCID